MKRYMVVYFKKIAPRDFYSNVPYIKCQLLFDNEQDAINFIYDNATDYTSPIFWADLKEVTINE